jgi:hypothetical protein
MSTAKANAITIKKKLAIARKPAAVFLFLHGKK